MNPNDPNNILTPLSPIDRPSFQEGGKRILVIEDDGFLREIYMESLSSEDYLLDTATDGDQAFEKIKLGGWDLVLCDIVMPKMDGLQVVQKLQSDSTVQGKKLYKKISFFDQS